MVDAPSWSTPQQLTSSLPLPPTPQQQLRPRRRHQSTNQIAGWTLQVNHADQSDCRLDTTGKSTPTNQIAGWTHHADQSDCRLDTTHLNHADQSDCRLDITSNQAGQSDCRLDTTHLNHADQSDCRLDITSNQAGQSDCFMYCTLYFVQYQSE